jgi:eukaryotic-like serine/threonine-protein kinase
MLARLFVESARDRDAIEEHLDGCVDCRELVAAYARATDDSAHPYAPTISTDAPPPSGNAPYVGLLVANRYRLERIVGEGGMGVVWAARDVLYDRVVALKIVKNPSPELAQRTLREASVLARVGHPSLIEVQAVVALGEAPVLVMPLLEGESLDRMLARRGQLDEAEAIAILEPVVAGMCAAHARGVIHRDLKPPNVFLAEDGGERVVVVLDFGLAKLLSPDGSDAGADKLTRTGALLGTPFYMAPEQLFGEGSVDAKADVWAVGVMLYECLSGNKPVQGKSYGQIAKNVAVGAITPLDVLVPSADRKLCQLVARMLEKERDLRPDLFEVHAVLASLLHARPRA